MIQLWLDQLIPNLMWAFIFKCCVILPSSKAFLIKSVKGVQGDRMSTKLSRLYGLDIFTDSGKFIGTAQDFIVDFESGEVSRILLEALPSSKDDAKRALRDKSIMYKNVKSVEDVIVVTKGPIPGGQ